MALVYRVGHAVCGDPRFGRDSALLEAMGLTREYKRRLKIRRGMRRAKRSPPVAQPSAAGPPRQPPVPEL